jgi:hypothetical protein
MKKFLPAFFLAAALFAAAPVFALTLFESTETCPFDKTTFSSQKMGSGTTFGYRLDLKPLGAVAAPAPMGQCPKCSFPMYEDSFSKEDIEKLQPIVESERFAKEAKGKSPYLALGVVFEMLEKEPGAIAWTYLRATWENENKPDYDAAAKKAIEFFTKASAKIKAELKDGEKPDEKYFTNLCLAIELSRRIKNFDEVKKLIAAARVEMQDEANQFLLQVLDYEERLATEKDSAPHPISDVEKTL